MAEMRTAAEMWRYIRLGLTLIAGVIVMFCCVLYAVWTWAH